MTGKQKCKILKEIRRQIAEANDIRYVIEECSHKGKCRGTCPKCEWEVRELERALEKRRLSGKKVVLAGISAGMIVSSTTACAPVDAIENAINRLIGNEKMGELVVEGDVPYPPETHPELIGETEQTEPLMGEPPIIEEGEIIDIPGELVEETAVGEVMVDVDGLIAPPVCETAEETDDMPVLAGVPIFEPETAETESEWEGEFPVLEGDVAWPVEEEE